MSETRTILILGAGVMQLPAIRAARRLGLRVLVVDGNASAPGIAEADQFEHVDLRDTESIVELAKREQRSGRLDAVFTAGTDFSVAVASVSEALGLPGTSLESARNATDKFRMRRILRDAGVQVPDFAVLGPDEQSVDSVTAAVDRIGLPCVVKPADSMGARGVVRADSVQEAVEFAGDAAPHSRTGRVIIEGYIDGPEFSVDALVYRGEVMITGFADRHISFAPYFIEMGHTIPSSLTGSDYERVISEFRRGVAAIGISDGAAKGDMKLSSAGPVVGEIAARLSGGYMSGWTYPLSSGVELTERAIRIALGQPPGSLSPAWRRTSAERAIVSMPGIVSSVDGVQSARSTPEVAEIFIKSQPGEAVALPTSNVEKCGNVIAVGKGREEAMRAAEAAVARLEVVLLPHTAESDRFLYAEGSGRWAFAPETFESGWVRQSGIAKIRWPPEAGDRAESPVGLGAIPESRSGLDWSWRSFNETVARLEEAGVVTTRRYDPAFAPAVWRAILKGGLQGGSYAVRTLVTEPDPAG